MACARVHCLRVVAVLSESLLGSGALTPSPLPESEEGGDQSGLPLDHLAAGDHGAAARLRRGEQRRDVGLRDDVGDDRARSDACRIAGQRIAVAQPERGGVGEDVHVVAVLGDRLGLDLRKRGTNRLGELLGTARVDIAQRERGDAGLRQRHPHRARHAPGADQMHALCPGVDAAVPEAAQITSAIEHVAYPAPVRHPPRHVDRADQPAVVAQLVDMRAHGVLVRHGDDQPVAVAQALEPGDGGVEAGGVHLGRHHHRIDAALGEHRVEALGRAHARERVAQDGVEPRRSGYRHKTLMCRPPSMCRASPVENGSSPAASIATARPMSSGSPQRRTGAIPSAISLL